MPRLRRAAIRGSRALRLPAAAWKTLRVFHIPTAQAIPETKSWRKEKDWLAAGAWTAERDSFVGSAGIAAGNLPGIDQGVFAPEGGEQIGVRVHDRQGFVAFRWRVGASLIGPAVEEDAGGVGVERRVAAVFSVVAPVVEDV